MSALPAGTAVEIGTGDNRVEITVEGDAALETLQRVMDDGYIEAVDDPDYYHVEVANTTADDPDAEIETRVLHDDAGPYPDELRGYDDAAPLPPGLRDSGGDRRTGPMHIVPERSDSHSERKWTKQTDEDREAGTVSEDSSHHALLSLIGKAGDDGIRPKTITERYTKMPSGTVSGGLQQLWCRKLVDRYDGPPEEDDEPGSTRSVYYVATDRGREWLDDHGHLTIDEWAGQ